MASVETQTAQGLITSLRASLSRSEANEAFAESVAGLIVRLDAPEAGLIMYATEEADALFGFIPGEVIGRHIKDLMPERFRAGHDAHFKGFSDHPSKRPMGATHMKIVGLRRDGTEIPLAIALRPKVVSGQRCAIAVIVPLAMIHEP